MWFVAVTRLDPSLELPDRKARGFEVRIALPR
jgi:hypothetical protein